MTAKSACTLFKKFYAEVKRRKPWEDDPGPGGGYVKLNPTAAQTINGSYGLYLRLSGNDGIGMEPGSGTIFGAYNGDSFSLGPSGLEVPKGTVKCDKLILRNRVIDPNNPNDTEDAEPEIKIENTGVVKAALLVEGDHDDYEPVEQTNDVVEGEQYSRFNTRVYTYNPDDEDDEPDDYQVVPWSYIQDHTLLKNPISQQLMNDKNLGFMFQNVQTLTLSPSFFGLIAKNADTEEYALFSSDTIQFWKKNAGSVDTIELEIKRSSRPLDMGTQASHSNAQTVWNETTFKSPLCTYNPDDENDEPDDYQVVPWKYIQDHASATGNPLDKGTEASHSDDQTVWNATTFRDNPLRIERHVEMVSGPTLTLKATPYTSYSNNSYLPFIRSESDSKTINGEIHTLHYDILPTLSATSGADVTSYTLYGAHDFRSIVEVSPPETNYEIYQQNEIRTNFSWQQVTTAVGPTNRWVPHEIRGVIYAALLNPSGYVDSVMYATSNAAFENFHEWENPYADFEPEYLPQPYRTVMRRRIVEENNKLTMHDTRVLQYTYGRPRKNEKGETLENQKIEREIVLGDTAVDITHLIDKWEEYKINKATKILEKIKE